MNLALTRWVSQNPAIGMTVLWRFSRSHYETVKEQFGVPFPHAMLVLPIVLHRDTCGVIKTMWHSSGILKAIADIPAIRIGLQQRIHDHFSLTCSSLNLACQSKLLTIDRSTDWPRFIPAAKPAAIPQALEPQSEEVLDMCKGAERLGSWFARFDSEALFAMLDVTT